MVKSAKVADQRDFVNALYYGDGGTGKTTALASMAHLGRILYVDAESGIKRRPLTNLGIPVDNIELLVVDERLSYTELEQAFWDIKADLDSDPDSWAGTVWDSGTEIYHALIENIVHRRVEKAQAIKAKGGKVAEIMTDQFFTDLDDWGIMTEQIRSLMRRFRDLPCHFGTAFLERRDQDRQTKEVRIGPSITPGLQSDVIGWHDIVCRTSWDEDTDTYLGTFRPEGVRQGKDRFGLVPRTLVDPFFDRLVSYVTEELEEAQDARQISWQEKGGKEEGAQQDEPSGDGAADKAAPKPGSLRDRVSKGAVGAKRAGA